MTPNSFFNLIPQIWRSRLLFWVGLFLSVCLLFVVNPPLKAQIPSLPQTVHELINTSSRSLSGQTGNVLYAPVKIDGMPIFYVALPAATVETKDESATRSPLKDRVNRIENNLREIIRRDFDPDTLQIYPSVLNGQTIIRASDQKNLKPQTIGTITNYDAQLYGLSIEDAIPEITKILRESLLKARQERQPKSLQSQILLATKFLILITSVSLFLLILQRWLNRQIYCIQKSLSEFLTSQDTDDNNSSLEVSQDVILKTKLSKRQLIVETGDRLFLKLYVIFKKIKNFLRKNTGFKPDSNQDYQAFRIGNLFIHVDKNSDYKEITKVCKKRIQFLIFLRRLLTFLNLLILLRGLAFTLTIFPYGREIGIKLAGTPIYLISIWLLILILIKIAGFIIDELLHTLEEDMRLVEKAHSRKALRIPTISNALKSFSFVIFFTVGIFLSLGIFNVPTTTILAGAGIFGFAISFGSQSLIKDLIAGIINLFNDAYAVGDFVIIGTDQGLVEDLNLFVTRLRSSNGDLITIPNGSVIRVCNQTKDWSRVDYSIQVSYDTNLQKALAILYEIANNLYHDPHWHSMILESPDLKGVEEITHQGVILRVWVKTKPGDQWVVARELRLRLKSAFEEAGIGIGIPQQTLLLQNSEDKP